MAELHFDREQVGGAEQHVIDNPEHQVLVTMVVDSDARYVRTACQNCDWWNDLV